MRATPHKRFDPPPASPPGPRCSAFTLIELLVVMVIMAILISSVMVVSTTLINRSRTTNTQTVLTLVQDAVNQFQREKHRALSKARNYEIRFGLFPPDELEVFSQTGFPTGPGRSLANGEVVPPPGSGYNPMKFYSNGLGAIDLAQEHRDIAALYLAIELYGEDSRALLGRVPDRNWSSAPLDSQNDPAVFFDRRPTNGSWDPQNDLEVRYLLDDWGVPIGYLAQRDWDPKTTDPARTPDQTRSSNRDGWNEASTEFIRLNGGRPVLFSYGPDGKEQLTQEVMGASADASLVGDFEETSPDGKHRIDQPFNTDNVYANPDLKTKLSEGITP